jgi:accessory colonization factor AcfC
MQEENQKNKRKLRKTNKNYKENKKIKIIICFGPKTKPKQSLKKTPKQNK